VWWLLIVAFSLQIQNFDSPMMDIGLTFY
jgi:hypothetical protein